MSNTYSTFEGEVDGKAFRLDSNAMTTEQMAESEERQQAEAEALVEETRPEPKATEHHVPEEEPKHNGKARDARSRVLEATRNASEAKKRLAEKEARERALAEENERLKAEIAQRSKPAEREPEPPHEPKPAKEPSGRPSLADFDSIEDHAEAVAKWVLKQEREEQEREAKARAFEEYKERRIKTFASRMQKHLETDPEFWDRVNPAVVQLRPTSVMAKDEPAGPLNVLAEHFLSSENPVSLIEYFSNHPEEVNRFSQIQSEAEFWREVGKVERGLNSGVVTATPTVPETSKAAPPARPVTGGPPTGNVDPSKMSFEEYAKWQTAEDRKARRR